MKSTVSSTGFTMGMQWAETTLTYSELARIDTMVSDVESLPSNDLPCPH
ncbi:MAG: hypothetical protein GY832_34625 [Chloroflexi bacterium]|nr:hypothetical protein [Chloroflexota bacterium]